MSRPLLLCLALSLAACEQRGAARPTSPATALRASPDVVVFEGACDASGAVVLSGSLFVVGDDEDNLLRVYDGRKGGPPLHTVDLSPSLELPAKKKPPEADIEAATRLGGEAYWLTSHGLKSSGKKDESRFRFFATTAPVDGQGLQTVGQPYTHLFDDLLADPRMGGFELAKAETLPPKVPGGLNIEGMTAMADGKSLLIGFRNPVPQGKALVVELLNAPELVRGGRAKLGAPRLLDLGGLGVRSLSWWSGRYLIIAGSVTGEGESRLYTWRGGDDEPQLARWAAFSDLNPEGFVTRDDDAEKFLVLSDDGSRVSDGVECKRLKDAKLKRFRGLWVRPPADLAKR